MIYTDGIHIITDGEIEELHAFAIKANIKKHWFENKRGKNHPHYDIPLRNSLRGNKFLLEFLGAKYVTGQQIVIILNTISI